MGILNRLRDRLHPELAPDERAEFKRWAVNRERLIVIDPDASRILTIDPGTVRTNSDQVALAGQITAYVEAKNAKGEPYDGLWS